MRKKGRDRVRGDIEDERESEKRREEWDKRGRDSEKRWREQNER